MSGLLGKIPKFALKLPPSLTKAGRTMSECPLELSFSLCEDNSWRKVKDDQQQVEVPVLVNECKSRECTDMENFNIFEKADEEKSEKEDNMEVTCSVSVDGQEKQEFSFTLYDLDTKEKVNKQDVEKIVVRSICEALGKTLKLPPSGSRTIKVKLAISPDSSKDVDTQDLSKEWKQPVSSPEKSSPCKNQDYDSSKSANTVSTYLLSSATEKLPYTSARNPCDCASSSIAVNLASQDTKPIMSPKFRAVRHSRLVSLQKQEAKTNPREHRKKLFEENVSETRVTQNEMSKPPDDVNESNHQYFNSRDHVPESRERRNHYLDLAGVENDACSGTAQKAAAPSYVDPNYMCPYRILDRSHVCSKPPRNRSGPESPIKKSPVSTHPRVNSSSIHTETPQVLRTQHITGAQDDFLNLNIDLCDLVPDAKFDWEKIPHRRSRSHDLPGSGLHASVGLYSPKVRPKHSQNNPSGAVEGQKNPCVGNSPMHNYRVRHRDRERQRAMQQVASWIAREHAQEKVENETHFLSGGFVKSPENMASQVERHEHHHIHEHVHHHYHHFVDF